MYFFIETSRKLSQKAEQFDINYQEVYTNVMQEMQSEYSLPALNELGDGYCQGDASNDDIIKLVQHINTIENNDEPTVYAENDDENDGSLLTDVFEYLDRKLIDKIENAIDSQILVFGNDEYSKNQFDAYKDKAESVIKKLLDNEYYKTGEQIGHDYSVYFLADEMRAIEHIEASSNWMFQHENEARFKIVHLNNYNNAFKDYTDLIGEEKYRTVRDNLDCSDESVLTYMIVNDIEVVDGNILDAYFEMSFNEKVSMWDVIANEGIVEYDGFARSEAIDNIIESIEWNDIEFWFNDQFETEV